ncbi:protein HID1-like isoform X1 [Acanthaster planci]|uniref:Protein HID1-like isoform X1 n=1 Tax=Acanthaster planci TaxID=133434 RepID=A0A8B7YJ05_ACAPL|nr:protein HID1-like isoform X1 [Acanthaster planci]
MGGTDSKLNFRKAVVQLTTKTQPVEAGDDAFWDQFWADTVTSVGDVFALIPAAEIRALREESPSNLATLCYKAVEKLVSASEGGCALAKDQQVVLNSVRLLTRILPYIFEDPDWRGFFWSTLPGQSYGIEGMDDISDEESLPLAQSLLNAIADLLFCPDFTVASTTKKSGPDNHEDLQSIDSCEYIWEAGVGFANSPPQSALLDQNRTELLKLLLTCFSETMYLPPVSDAHSQPNQWISYFCSSDNRHALPLFTSLLNIVCAYDPVGYGVPYNHLLFADNREPVVEVAAQLLVVTLDHDNVHGQVPPTVDAADEGNEGGVVENLFVNYLSRVHREEDFHFILKGLTRLLNNPLIQTYLPGSTKKIAFHQELLVLFWKMCDHNKKFLFYVLKSSDVLEVLVPILYHLNDARADQSRVGLMHIGVFILLLLSGERNFGVRLNKPYSVRVPMDIPVFTGTHADFLIIVFHKIITSGHQRLAPLYDCLLTIIVNVSPYLKSLSMVSANKLLHLLEAFSTPWFLFSNPANHHLVFFLLEVFNNIIQYQFDGNSNLVYTIIRKRNVFHQLANLPCDQASISKALAKRGRKTNPTPPTDDVVPTTMEGALPPVDAEPGTLKASLLATPGLGSMTETSKVTPSGEVLSTGPGNAVKADGTSTAGATSQGASDTESIATDDKKAAAEGGSPLGSPSPTGPIGSQAVPIGSQPEAVEHRALAMQRTSSVSSTAASSTSGDWRPSPDWVQSWKQKLPLQTIMRLLQVLVPQVEKICIDKGLTDETEILKFLQHGTLVGLLPVPHPILIRKYQANSGTTLWFRTYMWGVIYLRNVDPPIWYDTGVKLFEVQRIKDS